MKVVTVSAEQKFLFDLLMKVQEEGLILQTTDGQQFVLLSLEDWQGFDVGDSDDFEQEVESMQIENESVQEAKKGDSIGLKVKERVRRKDVVYKLVEE